MKRCSRQDDSLHDGHVGVCSECGYYPAEIVDWFEHYPADKIIDWFEYEKELDDKLRRKLVRRVLSESEDETR